MGLRIARLKLQTVHAADRRVQGMQVLFFWVVTVTL
jgi:valyl-tRNA synthetase